MTSHRELYREMLHMESDIGLMAIGMSVYNDLKFNYRRGAAIIWNEWDDVVTECRRRGKPQMVQQILDAVKQERKEKARINRMTAEELTAYYASIRAARMKKSNA